MPISSPRSTSRASRLPRAVLPARAFSTRRPAAERPSVSRSAALLAALALVLALPAGAAERPRYDAHVSWEPASGLFEVTESITWTNRSARSLDALSLLHPWRAFAVTDGPWWRSARSLGLRLPRASDAPEASIVELRGPKGEDWFARLAEAPEPGSGVYRLALPEPLSPGARLSLRLRTRARLSGILGRVGRRGDFLAAAGWLVRVAPFDAAKHELGEHPWADEPAHVLVEPPIEHFDARWSARLPARYAGRIAATGWLKEERIDDGRVHASWRADGVVELALFADPRFQVTESKSRSARTVGEGPLVRVFAPRAHDDLARGAAAHGRGVLKDLRELLGERPAAVSIVDPPHTARGVSGMEYPGVVVVRLRAGPRGLSEDTRRLLRHELAHQVFYASVATDTVKETFLEEGLATLLELREPAAPPVREPLLRDPSAESGRGRLWAPLVRADVLGAGPGRPLRRALEAAPASWIEIANAPQDAHRVRWLPHAGRALVRQDGRRYANRDELLAHAYSLSALTIRAALSELGIDEDRALESFAHEFAGRRASSRDFIRTLERVSEGPPGKVARVFGRYWDEPGWVDARVAELACAPSGGEESCVVRFEHRGPWRPALEVWLADRHGRVSRHPWPAEAAGLSLEADRGREIVSAGIESHPLDVDHSNDSLFREPRPRRALEAFALVWRQICLRLAGLGRLP